MPPFDMSSIDVEEVHNAGKAIREKGEELASLRSSSGLITADIPGYREHVVEGGKVSPVYQASEDVRARAYKQADDHMRVLSEILLKVGSALEAISVANLEKELTAAANMNKVDAGSGDTGGTPPSGTTPPRDNPFGGLNEPPPPAGNGEGPIPPLLPLGGENGSTPPAEGGGGPTPPPPPPPASNGGSGGQSI